MAEDTLMDDDQVLMLMGALLFDRESYNKGLIKLQDVPIGVCPTEEREEAKAELLVGETVEALEIAECIYSAVVGADDGESDAVEECIDCDHEKGDSGDGED